MTFLKTKGGVLVIAFIALFGFLYFFTGAFGGTFIGLTLRSNPDLQNGLVAHYTFDGKDVDVSSTTAEIADTSGNNNKGNFVGEAFGEMLWATTTDPSSNWDYAQGIATDASGNVYVTGYCDGCGSAGFNANYTYKIDGSDGSMLWATTTDPTSGHDEAYGIATDESGDVYVTGLCQSGCGSAGSNAHYTYKIDGSDGSMLWATTTDPTSSADNARAIATDASGNVYVTGFCDGCGSKAGYAHYTYKIDGSDGSMLWATTTDPTSSSDKAYAIATDGSGNVYVTGYCGDCGSAGLSAHYTYKIDASNGDMLWATTTDPTSSGDRANAIATDASGNAYVTGDCGTGCGSVGQSAHYTYKIDGSDGSMLWATTTDLTSSGDIAYGIATDASGNVYVTGYCWDCGNVGSRAHYTYKIDGASGSMLWATTTDPTSSAEFTYGIATDASGNVYVTGDCEGCGSAGGSAHYTYKIRADTYAKDALTLGNIGQGMEFDGVDDYVDLGSPSSLDDIANLSMCVWIKPNSCVEDCRIFVKDNGIGYGGPMLIVQEANQSIEYRNGYTAVEGWWTTDPNTVVYGEWMHVCATHDTTSSAIAPEFYLNGASVNVLETLTPSGTPDPDASFTAYIGNRLDLARPFDGKMDDMRVYNRILSDDDVLRLYQLGATTKIGKTLDTNPDLKDGLEMHWTFDGPKMDWSSTTAEVRDSSMNAIKGNADTFIESAPGVIGQGIEFQGSTWKEVSAIDDNDDIILGTGDMTIAGWLRSDEEMTIGTEPVIISNRTGSNGYNLYYEPQFSDFRVAVGSTTGGTLYDSNTFTLETGEWNHITAAIDRDKGVLFYINGEFINRSGTSAYDGENITNNSAKLGSFDNNVSLASYDDVRIYSKVLSTSTIKRLYQLGATTKISKTIDTNPDLKNGLVGHWTFDGWPDTDISSSTAEVKDVSGNDNHGDWKNHATTTEPGVLGQAIDFDGVDDHVFVGTSTSLDFTGTQKFTITAWVNPASSQPGLGYIVSAFDAGVVGNWHFSLTASNQTRVSRECGLYSHTGSEIPSNEWTFFAYRYNNSKQIYINGEYDSEEVDSCTIVEDQVEVIIGAGVDGVGAENHFAGDLDDVRVYNRALSDEEIQRLYNLGN